MANCTQSKVKRPISTLKQVKRHIYLLCLYKNKTPRNVDKMF